jgi:hypothetical protein
VALQAGTRIFQVFAAILKAQSSVFADMFTFPRPASGSTEMETMDGLPFVTLHDDPDEAEVFLKGIFDSRCANSQCTTMAHVRTTVSYFTPSPVETPFEAIAMFGLPGGKS